VKVASARIEFCGKNRVVAEEVTITWSWGPGVIFIMRQDLRPFVKVRISLREDMRTFPAGGRKFAERHRCGKHYNIWGEEFCVGEVEPQEN
ncbi:hypothetical protein KIN20_006508, partial [Parelaphostrongylus tenuis]